MDTLVILKKTLGRVSKYIGILIIILAFTSCKKAPEFEKIDFDWTIDVIENIGRNLNPNEKYEYWALLRSSNGGHEHVDILHEKGKIDNRSLLDMSYSQEGFIVRGHHATKAYYIIAVENGKVSKIKNTKDLKLFLGKIDTMEEALLLTQIEEFKIDYCDAQGSSYRKTTKGFEFYLMTSNVVGSLVILESLKNTQYLVSVDHSGSLNSKSIKVYCQGKRECLDC
jgi:hypothetical protein